MVCVRLRGLTYLYVVESNRSRWTGSTNNRMTRASLSTGWLTMWACAICTAEVEAQERPRSWCRACGADGMWVRPHRRRVTDVVAAGARAWTSREVVSQNWDVRRCPVTGVPWSIGCLILMYGPPGSGKSTLAVQVAAAVPPITIVSAEESAGPALARRLVLAGLGSSTDATILRDFDARTLVARAARGGAIVVDSVSATSLQASDLRGLCDAGAHMVIGVVQVTKAGRAAGPNKLIHEADLVLHVEGGTWVCEKSRFGPIGRTGAIRGVASEVPS